MAVSSQSVVAVTAGSSVAVDSSQSEVVTAETSVVVDSSQSDVVTAGSSVAVDSSQSEVVALPSQSGPWHAGVVVTTGTSEVVASTVTTGRLVSGQSS